MNSQHYASLFVFGGNIWENALKADILQKQLFIKLLLNRVLVLSDHYEVQSELHRWISF